ncbi:MAG TPA: SpoIIE family protein phosphatase [Gaiellaceae bacterium]|nr:SpoIIE family protein phosphatase [Gaiellaceae bacterium]
MSSLGPAPARVRSTDALTALAEASRSIAAGAALQPALEAVLEAAALSAGAELGAVWLRERDGWSAQAVWAESSALAAEVEGLRADHGSETLELLRRRVGDGAALSLGLESRGETLGSLELVRGHGALAPDAERVAALAADLAALALELADGGAAADRDQLLDVVGDALAAAAEDERSGARVARVAAIAAAADAALVWRARDGGVEVEGSYGGLTAGARLREAAASIVDDRPASAVEAQRGGTVVTLQLGRPPVGALQLLFASRPAPGEWELARLTSFAVRAAHALRAAERARLLGLELERSRSLLSVVAEAIARLSLSHTLETALERLSELFATERVAVYLQEEGVLGSAAARGLQGPHERVAVALFELALQRRRGRGLLELSALHAEELAPVRDDAVAAGIDAVVALPLLVADEPIGLLALYPQEPLGRAPTEAALLEALAAQLAVAVHNARLHEQATQLGRELEVVLESERESARRLGALYEISRSFAQSLSLETTLDVLAESIVTLLGIDAAVIRMPDERGHEFTARAVYVDDRRADAAARTLLSRPQPVARARLQAFVAGGIPMLLTPETAEELGGSLALLAPFLEKGSSAALVPIMSAGELVATLTLISLDPRTSVAGEISETALSIAAQAALAIDNARLYAHQKQFADTMQRSLLPQTLPEPEGLELGDVYESSARVDVGGDVYDYLALDDGRLAVVLGDVMGHGVEATADMAMAKFVFRSLARVHTDPGIFLAAANDVVCSDIAPGKFITMVEVVVDAARGEVACAGGGHPAPRLVLPDGTVEAIDARGLALGIEPRQRYATVRAPLVPGAAVVLYTDGVVEGRRGGEQFGLERFDALLAEHRSLPAKELALAALAACREWADGDLGDDFAVVVIKRRTEA